MRRADRRAEEAVRAVARRLGPPERLLAAALALATGAVVWYLAVDLFAYHSVNDDEGVYLLQAAMLLDGQVFLYPGDLAGAVRPWFFVVDRGPGGAIRMYSKYAPVAPAVFALGKAGAGDYRVALAAVAAGNAALTYALTAAAFDRRTGLVAVVALAGAPLFLVTSSVFLAYAPTTLFNLAFAVCYVRAARTGWLGYALVAGAAIGVAFLSRPYTALLFALPFVAHALAVLWRARRTGEFPSALRRYAAVAVPGLAFVGITLGYNALVTGDPLLFPYAAFGPRDGLGFGERALLGHGVDYTSRLALATTVAAVSRLLVEWTVAGPVGTVLAAVGLGLFALELRGRPIRASTSGMTDREVGVVLVGVFASVIAGNALFWGTYNGLLNGLIDLLGPYYHFDVLLPLSAFAAAGAVRGMRLLRRTATARLSPAAARAVVLVVLLVGAPVVVAAERGALADPVAENRLRTENLGTAYEPIERTAFARALVFVPTPYGAWSAHPFQHLRNDPGFDGPVIYAQDRGPARDLKTIDAAGDRALYRFTYRGRWTGAVTPVEPELRRLTVLRGERIEATTTVGAPEGMERAWVRVETESGYARYAVDDPGEAVTVEWTVGPRGARATSHPFAAGRGLDSTGGEPAVRVPEGASEVDLTVTFADRAGGTLTYRQELTVEVTGEGVRAVWPPEARVCALVTECGTEGTYVGPDGEYVDGVAVETDARATNASRTVTDSSEPAARGEDNKP
ncbi:glycosyltransferase family 39 protein [Halomarina halobia]|uniref:Glycosyltransferase family 39 protein n=1 Tax=Halomarina halobia TaxID=3033386 RepID=A0ABD6A6N1_9EURY|nr:glycosyltransferase family 39 protein [Halomarina sp. PSR21]